jgi:hypothetical protein
MQLEGSVFAVLVVQLKPQMETLLALPPNSLIKEIALTRKLLSLFIDQQVCTKAPNHQVDHTWCIFSCIVIIL